MEWQSMAIPKKLYRSIDDLNDEIAGHLLRTVVKVAKAIKHSIQPEGIKGITLWQSNGEAAGQEIEIEPV